MTDSRRLNTLATWLLLDGYESPFYFPALDGLHERRYRLDSRLIADLYAVLPQRLRVELMSLFAVSYLDPGTFKALFFPLYRQRTLSVEQRRKLAQNCRTFLHRHPGHFEEYRDFIIEALRSDDSETSVVGLMLVGRLNSLGLKDLQLVKRLMLGRKHQRYAACCGLIDFVKRRHEVHPSVIEFCLQPEISQIAERIYKKDRDNGARRWGYYLLKALHRAGGPIAPGKKPYAPELDPPVRNRAPRRRVKRVR